MRWVRPDESGQDGLASQPVVALVRAARRCPPGGRANERSLCQHLLESLDARDAVIRSHRIGSCLKRPSTADSTTQCQSQHLYPSAPKTRQEE